MEVIDVMKRYFFCSFLFALSFCLFCCSNEQTQKTERKDIVAKVNNYELTLKEFDDQLVENLNLDKDFKLTKEAKKVFLDQLIRKELLIQEAKRLNLDRKKKFIKTIQRYWESTLIRNLMELKGKEIVERTYVTQEEIETRYKEMRESEEGIPPLEKIQEKINRKIMKQKKRHKLKLWINSLRKNAKIEIDQKLLYRKE